jgi:hypothetical protein
MSLPIQQTNILPLNLMQKTWAAALNPVLGNPATNPVILTGIVITTGVNVINHRLGRIQQGWVVSDINAAVTLYRSQPFNDLTLTLTASGAATVNLEVF